MLKNIIFLIIMLQFNYIYSQINLVPNGSFEDTVGCPLSAGELSKTKHWYSPTLGSPDYYNSCSAPCILAVPCNLYGNQIAKDGNAYTGIVINGGGNDYREYISIKMKQVLLKDKNYRISFFMSHADLSAFYSNNVGICFSNTNNTYNIYSNIIINNFLSYDSLIFNDNDWKEIIFNYKADGNESYLTIGNFKDDINSQIQVKDINLSNEAYYYIDNISVTEVTDSSVYNIAIPQIITPNGDGHNDFLFLNTTELLEEGFKIEIYNRWGNIVFTSSNINFKWYGTYQNNLLPSSTYYILINGIKKNLTAYTYKNFIQLIK